MTESVSSEQTVVDEEPPSPEAEIEVELIVDEVVAGSVSALVSSSLIGQAVLAATAIRGFFEGTIGVRITDDVTIRELNAKHLGHDYATDVISFGYFAKPPRIEGELVVSVDTAVREAALAGWSHDHELLLYIVHGVLHNTGMDDHDPDDRAEMRAVEKAVFLKLGISEIARCGADTEHDDAGRCDDLRSGDQA